MTIAKPTYAWVAAMLLCTGCQPPAQQQQSATQKNGSAVAIDTKTGKPVNATPPPDMGCTNGLTPAGQPCAPATRGPG